MADTIWVYAEISDDKITTTSLEMLAKAAEVGKAEVVLLGPAADDAEIVLGIMTISPTKGVENAD